MKAIIKATLVKATLYGLMIAFAAHIVEAIPFPYHAAIAALPVSVQTMLFFVAGFLIYFVCVMSMHILKAKHGPQKQ